MQVLTSEEKTRYIEALRRHPEIYLKRRFDMPHWHDGMRKMLAACREGIETGKPVVVGSGHAQSKDYLFGRMPLWFMEAYGPGVCLMTGPTERQVQRIMWAELTKAYNTRKDQADGFGQLYKTRFEIDEDWYILPFTTKDTGQAVGKFQGFHAANMMAVFSEAQAIPDEVYDQVQGCLTGSVNLWVMLGNPITSTGRFAQMLNDRKNNIVVHLSALESPNYKSRAVVVPGMATYEWVEDKRKKWGEGDPRWQGRVLGEVPEEGLNTVISQKVYEMAQRCLQNWAEEKAVVACDVATSGEDDAQIYGGRNGAIVKQKTISGSTDLRILAQEMFMMKQELGANCYIYDGNGVGDGLGHLIQIIDKDPHKAIIKVKGSTKSMDEAQYLNKRAELHFAARKAITEGWRTLPPDDEGGPNDQLKEELTVICWFINRQRDRVQVEGKDDIKDKLGHSPNRADAYILLSHGFDVAEPLKATEKRVETMRKQSHWSAGIEEPVTMGSEYGDWGDSD